MSQPASRHVGTASKGEFIPDAAGRWRMALGALEGRRVQVSLGRETKRKSAAERRYYFAVIVKMVADEIGEFGEEGTLRVHEGLKRMFLTVHEDSVLPRIRSTEELTTVECEEYHSKCRMWASQFLHIFIPDPNQTDY